MYYLRSFVKAISVVSQKVLFSYFEFSEEELEEIVKASANSKELCLFMCCIHCTNALDFSTQHHYSTEILDFACWGLNGRNSDWLSDPSLFENIVEAISKCGLRNSLHTVKIRGCELEQSQVKEMFRKYGINNISVEGGDTAEVNPRYFMKSWRFRNDSD